MPSTRGHDSRNAGRQREEKLSIADLTFLENRCKNLRLAAEVFSITCKMFNHVGIHVLERNGLMESYRHSRNVKRSQHRRPRAVSDGQRERTRQMMIAKNRAKIV